jgi:cytidylate kinase
MTVLNSPLNAPLTTQQSVLHPVIAIDGPTASGKGTVASLVAQALGGWHILDSGALYRLSALNALNMGLSADQIDEITHAASHMQIAFSDQGVWLDSKNVTDQIRQEEVGNFASQIASSALLRATLLDRQHAFRLAPGLVADGRDMGTVVFPDAPLKIFLVADVQARAQRRCKQLIEKGISANIEDLLQDMRKRDARDTQRAVAPLVAAHDAFIVDSSNLTIAQTVQSILDRWSNINQALAPQQL